MNNKLKNNMYDDNSLVSFESSMLSNIDNQSIDSNSVSVKTSDILSYKSNIDNQSINSNSSWTVKTSDILSYKSNIDNQSINSNNVSMNTADMLNLKSNIDNHSINSNNISVNTADITNFKSNIDNHSINPNNISVNAADIRSYKSTIINHSTNSNNSSNNTSDIFMDNALKMLINNQPREYVAFNHPYTTSMPNNIVDNKKIIIDVAVLCQEYTNVETSCDDNIINLEDIPVSMEHFQSIFYPYKDNFGINKNFMLSNKCLINLISFLPEHRIIQNTSKKFYLLEEIISNIERNLNITRNCFTKDSLVELTNEIISIKSLLDINCCSVLSSLSWDNVIEVIENYKFVDSDNNKNNDIIPICVVNIVFKTPTADVKNTTVRFNYKITNYK